MNKKIRIGTAPDEMSVWQAETVAGQLNYLEHETEIIKIGSIDKNAVKPVYKTGNIAVYTRYLDTALLNNQIDIAVHALKDVPPFLPEGIVQAAVLKRGNFNDVLILKDDEEFFTQKTARIATNSLRCKAQWLHRYPQHNMIDMVGDVKSRLSTLEKIDWDGAVFSHTELKKLNLLPENHLRLDWMLPAAGQGTIMISTLEANEELFEICRELDHNETRICTNIERSFLRKLKADNDAPVGALATLKNDKLKFKAAVFSPDGKFKIEFSKMTHLDDEDHLGSFAAQYILDRKGDKLMRPKNEIEKKYRILSTKSLSLSQISILSSEIQIDMDDFVIVKNFRLKPSVFNKTIENALFTSPDAVTSILNNFSPAEMDFENIFCAGRKTKRLIEKHLKKVIHYESSIEKLTLYLSSQKLKGKLTCFTGDDEAKDLIETLSSMHYEIEDIECFNTVFSSKKTNRNYNGILFFNLEGIKSFLIENNPDDLTAFCIGESAAALAGKHFKKVITARIPTIESLLKTVNETYQ